GGEGGMGAAVAIQASELYGATIFNASGGSGGDGGEGLDGDSGGANLNYNGGDGGYGGEGGPGGTINCAISEFSETSDFVGFFPYGFSVEGGEGGRGGHGGHGGNGGKGGNGGDGGFGGQAGQLIGLDAFLGSKNIVSGMFSTLDEMEQKKIYWYDGLRGRGGYGGGGGGSGQTRGGGGNGGDGSSGGWGGAGLNGGNGGDACSPESYSGEGVFIDREEQYVPGTGGEGDDQYGGIDGQDGDFTDCDFNLGTRDIILPKLDVVEFDHTFRPDKSGGIPHKDLGKKGAECDGLAADGVSRLLLRVHLGEEIPNHLVQVTFRVYDEGIPDPSRARTDDAGKLFDPTKDPKCESAGYTEIQVEVKPVETEKGREWMAFAVLKSPINFVREFHMEDKEKGFNKPRILTIEVLDNDDVLVEKNIELHRPPVVLIHGLWSNKEAWGWDLIEDPKYSVYKVDYKLTNASWYSTNVRQVRRQIQDFLQKFRRKGSKGNNIASIQVDVFGHSMGGILSRIYSLNSNTGYLREDNFDKGDIHKLITLNTPHYGSEFANLLVTKSGAATYLLGQAYEWKEGFPVDEGAVLQLRTDSITLKALNSQESKLPVHAMYGIGGTNYPTEGYAPSIDKAVRWLCIFGLDEAFNGSPHDCIVNVISQKGRLRGSHTTEVIGIYSQHGGDAGVTMSPVADIDARRLLDASIYSGTFSLEGFPVFFGELFPPPDCFSTVNPVAGRHLKVLIDSVSTTWDYVTHGFFHTGDTLTVEIQTLEDFSPDSIVVTTKEAKTSVTYLSKSKVEIQLSDTYVGDLSILAYGIDENKESTISDPLVVKVWPLADLDEIDISPELVRCYHYDNTNQVSVLGVFADDINRDITSSSTGTTYSVEDESIASVDSEGIVTGRRIGQAHLVVTNSGLSHEIEVIVESMKGDWDSNDIVDDIDMDAFSSCFTSDQNDPNFVQPSAKCLDIFDFDFDGDINTNDYELFLELYTEFAAVEQ
ncbi:esterase/lipase family protein, partial [Planctomycetota bacterium]